MSFVQSTDPVELARRFSKSGRLSISAEKIRFKGSLSQIKDLLLRIPPREVDLIYMYFILGKGQKQMARILGVTQGAISLRLRKAIKRLQFLINLPKVDVDEMRKDLICFLNGNEVKYWCPKCHKEFENSFSLCPNCSEENLIENIEVTIMLRIFETSCQSVVAREVGLSQCGVRHRFLRNLKKIQEKSKDDPKFKIYYTSLKMVSDNLNILREVEVPRWKKQRNIALSDIVV